MEASKTEFAVIRVAGGWRVMTADKPVAKLFNYKVDAEEAAIRLAAKAKKAGQSPEIWIHEQYGTLRRLRI